MGTDRLSAQALARLMENGGFTVSGDLVSEWSFTSSREIPGGIELSGAFQAVTAFDSLLAAAQDSSRAPAPAPAPAGSPAPGSPSAPAPAGGPAPGSPSAPAPEQDPDSGSGPGSGERSSRTAEQSFAKIAAALATLSARKLLPSGLVSSGIAAGPETVVFLPPRAVRQAFARLDPGARESSFAWMRSAKAKGPEAEAVFLLAQAAYRLACGISAFKPEVDPDETARPDAAFARGGFVPSTDACPGLAPELAALIDASLTDPATRTLAQWSAMTESLLVSGWIGKADEAAQEEAARRRNKMEEKLRAESRRSSFWRRKGTMVGVISASVALVLVVVFSVISDRGKGPDFSNLPAQDLVAKYYASLDAMDAESMAAAAETKAAKPDDTLVINLTVLTKMRMAYERKSPLVRAEEWLAAGAPAAETGTLVYGVTDLSITAAGDDWQPLTGTSPAGVTEPSGAVNPPGGATSLEGTDPSGGAAKPSGKADVSGAAASPGAPAPSGSAVLPASPASPASPDASARYIATYILWTTRAADRQPDNEELAPPVVEGRKLVDRLSLAPNPKAKKGRVGWKIMSIERTEQGIVTVH